VNIMLAQVLSRDPLIACAIVFQTSQQPSSTGYRANFGTPHPLTRAEENLLPIATSCGRVCEPLLGGSASPLEFDGHNLKYSKRSLWRLRTSDDLLSRLFAGPALYGETKSSRSRLSRISGKPLVGTLIQVRLPIG
jgi:hypothetical protein